MAVDPAVRCQPASTGPRVARPLAVLCALAAFGGLGGCAQMVVDAQGQRHLVGFMVLTLPPAGGEVAADSVRVRSLGLGLLHAPGAGGAVTLGYSDTTVTAVRPDTVLRRTALNTPPPADRPAAKEEP